jgi:predicted nucleic acid-binding protein
MTEKIVTNTSPLLAFAKMQAFEIIGRLPFEFICPAEVEQEILAGADQGYDVEIPDWLKIEKLQTNLSPLAVASLDVGEAAVIQLALEQNVETVCIDELKGRRAALAVGLKVVGSLGLLGKAKSLALITKLKPYIEKAKTNGIFYDENLIENFLKSFGE